MNPVCLLLCDDEKSFLMALQRMCTKNIPSSLNHNLERSDQVTLAAEEASTNPALPSIVCSDDPLLILELAQRLAALNPSFDFVLITDGFLQPKDDIRTGDDLILALREMLGPRLKAAALLSGTPGKFSRLAAEHGYPLIAKPPSSKEIRDLVTDLIRKVG